MLLKVCDRTIEVLKTAIRKAKLGQTEELAAIKRLDQQARRLERHAAGPSIEAVIAEERARSHEYGGRGVFGVEPAPTPSQALADGRAAGVLPDRRRDEDQRPAT